MNWTAGAEIKQTFKIAFIRQKKLILIFFLTIFLPSVALSIFGIIALRNERFMLEKQFREEQIHKITLIKLKVNQNIKVLESELGKLVQTPSFLNNESDGIITLVEDHLGRNQLSGQFFVVYNGNEPWFPPFLPEGSAYSSGPDQRLTDSRKKLSDQADNCEFVQKNYRGAVSLLEDLLKATDDKNLQGQLLNRIARNYMKLDNYEAATANYAEIIRNFPETRTTSGTLLPVSVRLQLADCYLLSGKKDEALKETLQTFEEVIRHYHDLSENQFSAYASLAMQKFNDIRNENPEIGSTDTKYADDFDNLNLLYQKKIREWQIIADLKLECVPAIHRELLSGSVYSGNILRFTKRIGADDFLIISSLIPGRNKSEIKGMAGIKINNTFFEERVLSDIIGNSGLKKDADFTLSETGGRIISGDKTLVNKSTNIISWFDNNFPPWRIDVPGEIARPLLLKGFYKSFYFWTILTLMVILAFGMVIISRTIAHEKEILKLKSDFVSSVSHEFKTPITSIKALTERLLDGAVKDPERIREYYAVISGEAENLNHLVGNILDFSKMEEGKKQYNIEIIDFKEWLEQTVTDFFSRLIRRKFNIYVLFAEPSLVVKIDKSAMKLAVNNLLDNAVKFSSENSEVKVILEKHEEKLLLMIKDKGIGISKNEQVMIFEKFYRSKNALQHSATGTGLGLTIVKQIVEAHRGEVRVESEPGAGSTFTVSIPLN